MDVILFNSCKKKVKSINTNSHCNDTNYIKDVNADLFICPVFHSSLETITS